MRQRSMFSDAPEAGAQSVPIPTQYQPLAERMRPRTLEEVLGQDAVIGPETSLGRRLRVRDYPLPSLLLVGSPGVGKTSLAQALAADSGYHFERLSGVLDGVKDLKEIVQRAEERMQRSGLPTLTLVDEIHRFNKAQQDAFLPHIERGLLVVIGQTTENVSFRIRNALLSRFLTVQLAPLSNASLSSLVQRALSDTERGMGSFELGITNDARESLCRAARGDARRLLNVLEAAAIARRGEGGNEIQGEDIEAALSHDAGHYDQADDLHYDLISAFIKSMRGSDPDAAMYYMLRMLTGGEDPLFITRRMMIFAAEDASCDPRALAIAVDVDRVVERVGLPEGEIPLAYAACYLASCPKSNAAYMALKKMREVVAEHPSATVPRRLRNASTELMRQWGNAEGYRYPHDYESGFVPERYLPDELEGVLVYEPSHRGIELHIRERLQQLRAAVVAAENKERT